MSNESAGWVERTETLDPANYDQYRPRYPSELFTSIFNFRPLHAGSRCLEIGVGTGQATAPVLQTGAQVMALEPDANLYGFVRAKYADAENFTVHASTLEEMEATGAFDLIYAATSFHWIRRPDRMSLLRDLLAPGGAVALFWNHPAPRDPVHAALQPVYEAFMPHDSRDRKPDWSVEDAHLIAEELREGGFRDVQTSIFRSERVLTSSEYVGLLHTYSDHISKPDSVRIPFMSAIREVIDSHGGAITIDDTVELHLGRL